jgi:hypothetical protein
LPCRWWRRTPPMTRRARKWVREVLRLPAAGAVPARRMRADAQQPRQHLQLPRVMIPLTGTCSPARRLRAKQGKDKGGKRRCRVTSLNPMVCAGGLEMEGGAGPRQSSEDLRAASHSGPRASRRPQRNRRRAASSTRPRARLRCCCCRRPRVVRRSGIEGATMAGAEQAQGSCGRARRWCCSSMCCRPC